MPDPTPWILGAALIFIGLGLITIWIRGGGLRRATQWSPRPKQHCPRCLYDLDGLPTLQCPECGCDGADQREWTRVYLYAQSAIVGAVLCGVSVGAIFIPIFSSNGWRKEAPTEILLAEWTVRGSMPESIVNEVSRRCKFDILQPWHRQVIVSRFADVYVHSPDPKEKKLALRLLGLTGPEVSQEADLLLDALESAETAGLAAIALGRWKIDPQRGVPRLVEMLEESRQIIAKNAGQRWSSGNLDAKTVIDLIDAIGMYEDAETTSSLIEFLPYEDRIPGMYGRFPVIEALARIGPEAFDAIDDLRNIANTCFGNAQSIAAGLAAGLIEGRGTDSRIEWAQAQIRDDVEGLTHALYLLAADQTSGRWAEECLVTAVQHPAADVQRAALRVALSLRIRSMRLHEAAAPLIAEPEFGYLARFAGKPMYVCGTSRMAIILPTKPSNTQSVVQSSWRDMVVRGPSSFRGTMCE